MGRFSYMNDTENSSDWLTIGETARRLGVSVGTIRRWESSGKITAVRTPGGQRRFPAVEVARLLGDVA